MPRVKTSKDDDGQDDWRRRSFGAASYIFQEECRSNWSDAQKRIARLVEADESDCFIGLLIAANSCLVILETNHKGLQEDVPKWISAATVGMNVIFLLEVCARLFIYRRFFFHSKWNVFDFFVVFSDVTAEILRIAFEASIPSVSILRIFRIMRLLRLVEFLTVFAELNTMVRLMFTSMRAMFWGTVLVIVTLTLWGIVAVELLHPYNRELAQQGAYGDCERCGKAFETVYQANITFFQTLIFGDSWGTTALVLIEAHPWTAIILVLSGVTVEVGLMNLIFTVIVDKAREQHDNDTELKLRVKENHFLKAKNKLKEVCKILDTDKSGQLELPELEAGFENNKDFAVSLSILDIDREDMEIVFAILDEDGSGSVTYDEFIEQLYKMKSQDSHTILLFIKGYVNELRHKMVEQMEFIKHDLSDKIDTILQRQKLLNDSDDRRNSKGIIVEPKAVLPDSMRLDLEILAREVKALTMKIELQSSQMFQNTEMLTACYHNFVHADKIAPTPPPGLLHTCGISLPRACRAAKPLTPHTINRAGSEGSAFNGLYSNHNRDS